MDTAMVGEMEEMDDVRGGGAGALPGGDDGTDAEKSAGESKKTTRSGKIKMKNWTKEQDEALLDALLSVSSKHGPGSYATSMSDKAWPVVEKALRGVFAEVPARKQVNRRIITLRGKSAMFAFLASLSAQDAAFVKDIMKNKWTLGQKSLEAFRGAKLGPTAAARTPITSTGRKGEATSPGGRRRGRQRGGMSGGWSSGDEGDDDDGEDHDENIGGGMVMHKGGRRGGGGVGSSGGDEQVFRLLKEISEACSFRDYITDAVKLVYREFNHLDPARQFRLVKTVGESEGTAQLFLALTAEHRRLYAMELIDNST